MGQTEGKEGESHCSEKHHQHLRGGRGTTKEQQIKIRSDGRAPVPRGIIKINTSMLYTWHN